MIRMKGDTIIELMLAFSIFSLASVGTIAIMNKGIAMSQQSLEMALVRAQMDGQAETIRYLRDTSEADWNAVKSLSITDDADIAPLAPTACPTAAEVHDMGGFFMNQATVQRINTGNYSAPATYATIDGGASYGIWAQVAQAEGSAASSAIRAYDVYIHACWDSVGNNDAPATLGTIVRIYDR
jgi:hypothetical protein